MNIPHSNSTQEAQPWPISSDVVFMTCKFLKDFPQYRPLFEDVPIPDDIWIHVRIDNVRATFGARFSAGLSIHARDQIARGMTQLIPHMIHPQRNITGYMTRLGEQSDAFHVAVTRLDENDNLDRGTVIHEYGHYVEQRVVAMRRQPSETLAMRNTAFMDAYDFVTTFNTTDVSEDNLLLAADELVAWANAIWLCWMLNIDPKTVAVGMVLDSISHPGGDVELVSCWLRAVGDIITERAAAEQIFGSVGPYTLCNALEPDPDGNDDRLCEQIDAATSTLLRRSQHTPRKES